MKCPGCGVNDVSDHYHPCPYEEEINDNSEDVCLCCEDCESECQDDI